MILEDNKKAYLDDGFVEAEHIILCLAKILNQFGTSHDDVPTEELWNLECTTLIL